MSSPIRPAPSSVDVDLTKMKLRLECLKLARRQDKAGLTARQSVKVVKRAEVYWGFVQNGVVRDADYAKLLEDEGGPNV